MRTAADVLSGFPSIVLGYVGYVALVVGLHWGYSLLPALLILSIMVVPYIAKSTETAVRQVPTAYREGAEALGHVDGLRAPQGHPQDARCPGIVTGLLIALAIACGETAPLLYTAGWSGSVWTGSFIGGHQFSLPDLSGVDLLQHSQRVGRTPCPTTPRCCCSSSSCCSSSPPASSSPGPSGTPRATERSR